MPTLRPKRTVAKAAGRKTTVTRTATAAAGAITTRRITTSDKNTKTETSFSVDEDLQRAIVSNLHQHATQATKEWFENYVKGTTWIGCKLPTVRQCVHQVIPPSSSSSSKDSRRKRQKLSKNDTRSDDQHNSSDKDDNSNKSQILLDTAVRLLQQPECDVKLAGMLILSECFPSHDDNNSLSSSSSSSFVLSSTTVLDRIEKDILQANPAVVDDWSTADWLANKVLRKIIWQAEPEAFRHALAQRVLDYARDGDTVWHRRCAVTPFVLYYNARDRLPQDMGARIVQACEYSLLASPTERFTQTGVAWVLRYLVSPRFATPTEREVAAQMILQHGHLWTMEAKKSIMEKLDKHDALVSTIRNL